MKKLPAEAELAKLILKDAAEGKLLTPDRRRRAVVAATERHGVSERLVCVALGQHRFLLTTAQYSHERYRTGRAGQVEGHRPGSAEVGLETRRTGCCAARAS